MEAADVFYNREDLWQFPRQPGGDGISMMTCPCRKPDRADN
jgi:hypothetical protein